jgi:tetratricopeptide (TPR) repeat protein
MFSFYAHRLSKLTILMVALAALLGSTSCVGNPAPAPKPSPTVTQNPAAPTISPNVTAGLTPDNPIITDLSRLPDLSQTNAEVEAYLASPQFAALAKDGTTTNLPKPIVVYVLQSVVVGYDKDNNKVYAEVFKVPAENPARYAATAVSSTSQNRLTGLGNLDTALPTGPAFAVKPAGFSSTVNPQPASPGPGITNSDPLDNLKPYTDNLIKASDLEGYVRQAAPKSPMLPENGGRQGLGQSFINAGMEAKVNPSIMLAAAQEKSNFGTSGWAAVEFKLRGNQNPFGFGLDSEAYPSRTLKVQLNEKFQPIYREENGVKVLANPKMQNWNSWVANWNSAIQSGTWYIADFKKQGNTVDTLKKAGLKPETIVKNVQSVSEFTANKYQKDATAMYKAGDFQKAEDFARQALALDNKNKEAWLTLSKALLETDKDNPKAVHVYVDLECPEDISQGEVGAYEIYFSIMSLFKNGVVKANQVDALKTWLKIVTDPKLRALYDKLIREIETAQQQATLPEPFEEVCE